MSSDLSKSKEYAPSLKRAADKSLYKPKEITDWNRHKHNSMTLNYSNGQDVGSKLKANASIEKDEEVVQVIDLLSSNHIVAGVNMALVKKALDSVAASTAESLPTPATEPTTPAAESTTPSEAKTPQQLKAEKKERIRLEKERLRMSKAQRMLLRGVESISSGDVLVCIDMESWERNNNLMTEVGVTIYDGTKTECSLVGRIRNEHFVIREYIRMRNGRFVEDNKFNYLLGKSKIQNMSECRISFEKMIRECERNADKFGSKVVFIGHGVTGDFAMLKKYQFYLGRNVTGNPEYLDTYDIWQVSRLSFGALGKVLDYLKIDHEAMHNAGNDAYFTMILGLCLCSNPFREVYKLNTGEINHLLTGIDFSNFPIREFKHIPRVSDFVKSV